MATFVLVAGSWCGGWTWSRIRSQLEQAGQRVLAPSLTGLADRHHLAGPDIGLTVHVDDIANLLAWEDLDDVVLVGHSYGGMVVTGVAARAAERLAHVVYVDAFAPVTGQCAFDLLPWLREAFLAPADSPPWAVPPLDFADLGVPDDTDREWLAAGVTPMPRLTHEEPLEPGSEAALQSVPVTYLHCAQLPLFTEVAADVGRRGFAVVALPDWGHMPMVTHPESLTRELLNCLSSSPAGITTNSSRQPKTYPPAARPPR